MNNVGHLHPLSVFFDQSMAFFEELGFVVAQGQELETEWFNFDFLRVPSDHPSRDQQDTFWVGDHVLRTHTTSAQGRIMQKVSPPCRFVMPGRVFRNEATDATHESVLHQLDGFAIAKNITMSHLIGTLETFIKNVIDKNANVRFRPHHYQFVEPGMDVDINRNGKWLEVIGSGMIHPEVLKNMRLNPDKWQGFAFGMGVERLAMIKYGIKDIRSFLKNDMRLIKQF
ncbi:MAG: phenylalanyl-tRNA synthetase alpha chain [Candidatus Berkelbacteria bacterium Licking1014_7]|uniref:phenylalanine--tRNA ligase n=1 Tax=Candidatus Berkelbacteria bacterium Licking1014_7 TaxID=2017147 RepID=A0A554LHZ0_9BACT|nr:MAG: phenylalanyl-tRNA synthetase alpha chain [Candidatus Berkelbacteria bacterium Licking1014_7]